MALSTFKATESRKYKKHAFEEPQKIEFLQWWLEISRGGVGG